MRFTWEQTPNPERYNIIDSNNNVILFTLETWNDAEIVTQFLNAQISLSNIYLESENENNIWFDKQLKDIPSGLF